MSDKIQIDQHKLKALLDHALSHGTLEAWSRLAIDYIDECVNEIERLRDKWRVADDLASERGQEIERLRADAMRYRWLKSVERRLLTGIAYRCQAACEYSFEQVDDAIDVARKEAGYE